MTNFVENHDAIPSNIQIDFALAAVVREFALK